MNVCQRPDQLELIYNNERRNRFPQASCNPGYNIPAEAFCSLPPTFVAQPFLRYNAESGEMELLGEAGQNNKKKDNSNNRAKKGPASAILDAADAQFGRPEGYSRNVFFNDALSSTAPASASASKTYESIEREACDQMATNNKAPWQATTEATRALYNGCEPCDLVLSCGPCSYGGGSGYAQKGAKKGEKLKVRPLQPFAECEGRVPTIQMPHMDTVEYADGDNYETRPMYLRTPISLVRGSNNPFLSKFSAFAFQQEKLREAQRYGIVPPFPKPCPPTPMGVAPRYDVPPREAREAQPIVLDQQVLFRSDNCGCNRSECPCGSNSGLGTTCKKCYGDPQSIAGIYARQSQ